LVLTETVIEWTPAGDQAGQHLIELIASDNQGGLDTLSFELQVENVNQPPVITVADTVALSEAIEGVISFTGMDPDGGAVTYELELNPPGMLIEDGTLRWTPTYNDAGQYQVIFYAEDEAGERTQAVVTLVVMNVNRPPQLGAIGDTLIRTADQLVLPIPATDPDEDDIRFDIIDGPEGGSIENGHFTWAPTDLDRGDHEIVLQGKDPEGAADSVTFQVFVRYTAPQARFDAEPVIGVVPLTVRFTDSSVGVVTDFEWTFGDGNEGTSVNPEHTYTEPGAFDVTLKTTNADTFATVSRPELITAIGSAVTLEEVTSEVGNIIEVTYFLKGLEGSTVQLTGEYSVDDEKSWRPATLIDDTVVLSGSDTPNQVLWHSSHDLPNDMYQDVWFRLQPSNPEPGWADTIRIDHIDNLGPSVVKITGAYGASTLTIEFDQALNVDVSEIAQFSLEGIGTATVVASSDSSLTLQIEENKVLTAGEIILSMQDVVDPFGNPLATTPEQAFTPYNKPPTVTVQGPEEESVGDVAIAYVLADSESNTVHLSGEFTTDLGSAEWQPATLGGDTAPFVSDATYNGTLLWLSATDLKGFDGIAHLRIQPDDGSPGAPDSVQVRVDNNLPPSIEISVDTVVARNVTIQYTVVDREEDSIDLEMQYSLSGEENWNIATLQQNDTLNSQSYTDIIVWDSFADLSYGTHIVDLSITASDADNGEPFRRSLKVMNLAADYDGNLLIDIDDLEVFLRAWADRDMTADIGPAIGSVPDLQLTPDGHLDFEDIMVLAQMWNWSTGLYPAAKRTAYTDDVFTKAIHSATDTYSIQIMVPTDFLVARLLVSRIEGMSVNKPDWMDTSEFLWLSRPTHDGVEVVIGSFEGGAQTDEPIALLSIPGQATGAKTVGIDLDIRRPSNPQYQLSTVINLDNVAPTHFNLARNYPNPFNPTTTIDYGVAELSHVSLEIFDLLGRPVTTLVSQVVEAGDHTVIWNGLDDSGRRVGSGVYLYRLTAQTTHSTARYSNVQRMILLR